MRHSLATRWFHWSQAALLVVLSVSGFSIYWPVRLQHGIGYHFVAAWLFVLNGLCYGLYVLASGHWRRLRPGLRQPSGLGPGAEAGTSAYSLSQRLAYSAVFGVQGLAALTGLALWKPVTFQGLTAALGGYQFARTVHFGLWLVFLLYLLVHVVQVARAGWPTLRAMIVDGGSS